MSQDARKLGGTPESPVRVDLPCAWYGKHIQDQTDWIWRIEPAHVEELDAALQKSKEKGLAEQEVTKEDFVLDAFGAELDRMVHELEYGRGFVLMRGFPSSATTMPISGASIGGLDSISAPPPQNIKGELIQIRPRLRLYQERTPGQHELRRVRPIVTSQISSDWFACAPRRKAAQYPQRDDHLQYLRQTSGVFARTASRLPLSSTVVTTASEHVTTGYRRLANEGYIACRFNQKAIEAGAIKAGAPLSDLEQAAVNFVGETAIRDDVELSMIFEPGDIQWLNNSVILHSRGHFFDDVEEDRKRLLRASGSTTTVPGRSTMISPTRRSPGHERASPRGTLPTNLKTCCKALKKEPIQCPKLSTSQNRNGSGAIGADLHDPCRRGR